MPVYRCKTGTKLSDTLLTRCKVLVLAHRLNSEHLWPGGSALQSRPMLTPSPARPIVRLNACAFGPVFALLMSLCVLLQPETAAAAAAEVHLEQLTWTEVRDLQSAGYRTVLIPIGGTEQNGPHMVLGKHNLRVRALASKIATQLGDTLVAPVLAYTPEGSIDPPTGHMRFAGTISVPDDAFKAILDGAARSLKQNGFSEVILIGDSGNYLTLVRAVVERLNRDWSKPAGRSARAHFISAYYDTVQNDYVRALRERGLSTAQIGSHAGVADTSLLLALVPDGVRTERLPQAFEMGIVGGTAGDPRAATAALGQIGSDMIVARTVAAIRQARSLR